MGVHSLAVASIILAAASAQGEVRPAMKLQPFDLTEVRLLEGPLAEAVEANRRYLLSLDPERLLYAFRQNAGLPTPGEPLGGWEAPSCEVRGHFVGHYLSACAEMHASTGDEALRERAAYMVAELAKCQEALGGYISAYPATFLDRLEAKQPVWAPLYVLHKIMAGLLDVHTLCGNDQALDVVSKMAGYLKGRFDRFPPNEMGAILDRTEEGGICDVLWGLYEVTGNPEHRALTEKLEKKSFLDPMARSEDVLTGRHGNTHIPLAIGAAHRYEITGESRYRHAAQFFWDRVITPRAYATGGTTDAEAWGPPFELAKKLSTNTHETCKTHNLLKLTRHLLCWTGETRYGDYYSSMPD